VQHLHPRGQRGERGVSGKTGCRSALNVEAVARAPDGVQLGERERRRLVRRDRGVDVDAIVEQQLAQLRPEAIRGQPAQVGHGLLEPAERARRVEGPAAGVRLQPLRPLAHEVEERLAADHDHATTAPLLARPRSYSGPRKRPTPANTGIPTGGTG
jgi:hypothetical protein